MQGGSLQIPHKLLVVARLEAEHLGDCLRPQLLDHLGLKQCPTNDDIGIIVALEHDELSETRTLHTMENHNTIDMVPVLRCRHSFSHSVYNAAAAGGIAEVNVNPLKNVVTLEDEKGEIIQRTFLLATPCMPRQYPLLKRTTLSDLEECAC